MARRLLQALLLPYFRVRVTGLERVPRNGPVILAINHLSMLDPLLIGVVMPRPVCFMAKDELFRYPLLGQVLRWVYAFPVRRGEADREAIHHALKLLREERVVGVFPEGTRSRDGQLLELQGGTALLALKSGAPILPVAIAGTERAMPKGAWWPRRIAIDIRVGQLLTTGSESTSGKKERIAATSHRLAEQLRELLGQRLPGEPDSPALG
ncbi:MAG: lysophospholipid acyltransferase family protein [Bacillota bacterium]